MNTSDTIADLVTDCNPFELVIADFVELKDEYREIYASFAELGWSGITDDMTAEEAQAVWDAHVAQAEE
jgi:hypothetical protein